MLSAVGCERAAPTPPVRATPLTENPFYTLLEPADFILASPVVVTGIVQVRRYAGAGYGEAIKLDVVATTSIIGVYRTIELDLSLLHVEFAQGTTIVVGMRDHPLNVRTPWVPVAGRDSFFVATSDGFERIRADGSIAPAGSASAIRCAMATSGCYTTALAQRGIVTPTERDEFSLAKSRDPWLPLLYLIAFRTNLVRRFPTKPCAELRWTCASSTVYRRLLRFGPVI